MATIDTKRRVKHYVLNDSRQWVDRGTGHVSWIYNDKQRTVSLIVKSESDGSILLEAKILLSIVYQRQQDTLIVWSDTNRRDLALSFQEKAGCDEIWEKICEVLGEDSSLDITSSRGATGTNGDNLDESDEDQLETDINTSPTSDLPQCELNKLKEIRDFFILDLPRKSKIYKERLATILETDSYIKKLIEIFHICEDLENTEGLHNLYEIFRCLFYLNKSSLLDILLSDDLIMDVIGCLEYDPNKPDVQRHREYITTKSNFKQVISFDNSDLINKIHQTYKVQYIQDVILPAPSVFEENSLTSLSSFIFLNKVEISNIIQEDERFLNELFENLKNVNLENEKRRDMLQFLREFTSFLHNLQQTREPIYKSLYEHGILDVIEIALEVKDKTINVIAVDILSQFVEVSPTLVREYILNEIESKSSVNNLNSSFKNKNNNSNNLNKMRTPFTNTLANQSDNSITTSPNILITTKTGTITTAKTDNLLITQTNSNEINTETCTDVIKANSTINKSINCIEKSQLDNLIKNDLPDLSTPSESNFKLFSLNQVLNTDEVFEPILINYVIRQMINDPDPELSGAMQIINVLKLLIDPENMLSAANKAEKSEFLSYFYRKSMCILINPLLLNTTNLVIHREDYRIAQLQNLVLDFLSFCVEHHTYHIKNYIVNKDLLKHILVLLKSKHQFLALSALRFLRKTLSLKEETYNKHIIKLNLFEPVIEALNSNGARYNIYNSAIVELFDFIRSDDIKSLMVYTVENFYQDLEKIQYVRTFKDLKLRYDQHKEKINDQLTRSRLNSSDSNSNSTPSMYRTRTSGDRYRDRIDFDKDDDAWIEDDDEEAISSENRIMNNLSNNNLNSNKSSSYLNNQSNSNQSSSSSSSSSDEQMSQNFQIESYLEFKKSQNLDENEDTLFSPAKTTDSPSSPTTSSLSSSSSSSSSSTKTINIKINTNVSITQTNLNKQTNSESESLNIYNNNLSPSSSASSTSSPNSSNLSTPSNSPLCNKKNALVDYEDDSDEETNVNESNSNDSQEKKHDCLSLTSGESSSSSSQHEKQDLDIKEPLSKRQATDSNSILTKLAQEIQIVNEDCEKDLEIEEQVEEENKENQSTPSSSTSSLSSNTITAAIVTLNSNDIIDDKAGDCEIINTKNITNIVNENSSDDNNNNLNEEDDKLFNTTTTPTPTTTTNSNDSQQDMSVEQDVANEQNHCKINNNLSLNRVNCSHSSNNCGNGNISGKFLNSHLNINSNIEDLDLKISLKNSNHQEAKNETNSPPLSPVSLSSIEPANKRARLSNS